MERRYSIVTEVPAGTLKAEWVRRSLDELCATRLTKNFVDPNQPFEPFQRRVMSLNGIPSSLWLRLTMTTPISKSEPETRSPVILDVTTDAAAAAGALTATKAVAITTPAIARTSLKMIAPGPTPQSLVHVC